MTAEARKSRSALIAGGVAVRFGGLIVVSGGPLLLGQTAAAGAVLPCFAIRKMHFAARAKGTVACPGGFGTLDEGFKILTLVQTGKMARIPIVRVGTGFGSRQSRSVFWCKKAQLPARILIFSPWSRRQRKPSTHLKVSTVGGHRHDGNRHRAGEN